MPNITANRCSGAAASPHILILNSLLTWLEMRVLTGHLQQQQQQHLSPNSCQRVDLLFSPFPPSYCKPTSSYFGFQTYSSPLCWGKEKTSDKHVAICSCSPGRTRQPTAGRQRPLCGLQMLQSLGSHVSFMSLYENNGLRSRPGSRPEIPPAAWAAAQQPRCHRCPSLWLRLRFPLRNGYFGEEGKPRVRTRGQRLVSLTFMGSSRKFPQLCYSPFRRGGF